MAYVSVIEVYRRLLTLVLSPTNAWNVPTVAFRFSVFVHGPAKAYYSGSIGIIPLSYNQGVRDNAIGCRPSQKRQPY